MDAILTKCRKVILTRRHCGRMHRGSWMYVIKAETWMDWAGLSSTMQHLISTSLPSHSHHQHQRSARSTSPNSPTLSKSSSIRQTHLQTTLHQQEIYPTLVSPQMAPCSSHVLERMKRVLSISAAHKTTPCFHNTKPAIIQMESGWPSSVMTTTFFIV